MSRFHGGPDALGVPRWDFSTNANACGPCPQALQAVQAADPTHYPDPSYAPLRAALAAFHQVAPERIVLLASASEGIARLTAWVARQGGRRVRLPEHAYGDYAQAAQAWGLQVAAPQDAVDLSWWCEPSSPGGQNLVASPTEESGVVVLDRAYEPLRLSGASPLAPATLDRVWQLWTPNKALGLTGLRGAYAIAPLTAQAAVVELEGLGPSWPLGAHAVAMLSAWTRPVVQAWLQDSLAVLRGWKAEQLSQLQALGWHCQPSVSNFFIARPPAPLDAAGLRARGLKLRDATSFGLPGHWRLSVQGPAARQALLSALREPGQGASVLNAVKETA